MSRTPARTPLALAALVAISALSARLLAPGPARAESPSCLGSVCLHVGHNEDGAWFAAHNASAAPVTIQLSVSGLRNLRAHPPLPARVLVPPGGRREISKLVAQSAGVRWRFGSYRWSWTVGDPNAIHDDTFRYRWPFGGPEARRLTQGVGGRFSHGTPESYHAFDFAMPVGTPILAARSGQVVGVADGYSKAGLTKKFLWQANAVTIMHADGTFASYGHLDPGSGVREGMSVLAGDVIGFSGNTGYSSGPHLHFSVWKPGRDGKQRTLPIRFHDGSQGFVPTASFKYGPGCHSEGVPCKPGDLPDEPRAREAGFVSRSDDGTCRCANGSVITTHLPCRMVCPKPKAKATGRRGRPAGRAGRVRSGSRR